MKKIKSFFVDMAKIFTEGENFLVLFLIVGGLAVLYLYGFLTWQAGWCFLAGFVFLIFVEIIIFPFNNLNDQQVTTLILSIVVINFLIFGKPVRWFNIGFLGPYLLLFLWYCYLIKTGKANWQRQ